MNISNSIGNVQAILLLVFAACLIWVAIKLTVGKAQRGDMGGTFQTVGAMLGPIILIAIALSAGAIALGSGLLQSVGINI